MLYKNSIFILFENHGDSEYLINTYTRSVVRLVPAETACVKALLQNAAPKTEKEQGYMRILISNGFLVPEETDELEWLEYLYTKQWFDSKNISIVFLPTLKCNFACPYCFETEKNIDMNANNLTNFIEYLKNTMKTHELLKVLFFGGEPLLKYPYIEIICKSLQEQAAATKCRLCFSLTSNGYLLNEATAKALLIEYGFQGFQITFDGNEEHHNKRRIMHDGSSTFSTVLANTKTLIKIIDSYGLENVLVTIRINYDEESIEEIREFLELFDNDEKSHILIYFRKIYNTASWVSRAKHRVDLHSLYELAKELDYSICGIGNASYYYCECDGGLGQLTVLPDLTVWKCANDYSYTNAKLGYIDSEGSLVLDEQKLAL